MLGEGSKCKYLFDFSQMNGNCQKLIKSFSANVEAANNDIEFAAAHKPNGDEFKIEIGGRVYTERKAAGEAIQKAAIKFMAEVGGEQRKPIGTFCGFHLSLEKIHNGFTVGAGISLRNKLTYISEIDITSDIGNVTRLENLFSKGFDRRLSELEEKLTRTQTDLQEALAEKSARLEQLNRELEAGQADEVIMNENEVQCTETHNNPETTASRH